MIRMVVFILLLLGLIVFVGIVVILIAMGIRADSRLYEVGHIRKDIDDTRSRDES
jgi:Na+-transporting NADH:ubiquinone oxidoreductase subunit NqrF